MYKDIIIAVGTSVFYERSLHGALMLPDSYQWQNKGQRTETIILGNNLSVLYQLWRNGAFISIDINQNQILIRDFNHHRKKDATNKIQRLFSLTSDFQGLEVNDVESTWLQLSSSLVMHIQKWVNSSQVALCYLLRMRQLSLYPNTPLIRRLTVDCT